MVDQTFSIIGMYFFMLAFGVMTGLYWKLKRKTKGEQNDTKKEINQ
jgi:hypothetical protein